MTNTELESEIDKNRVSSESTSDRGEQICLEIENEIECPRCHDVMALCSEFDNLYYSCLRCGFILYTIIKNLY